MTTLCNASHIQWIPSSHHLAIPDDPTMDNIKYNLQSETFSCDHVSINDHSLCVDDHSLVWVEDSAVLLDVKTVQITDSRPTLHGATTINTTAFHVPLVTSSVQPDDFALFDTTPYWIQVSPPNSTFPFRVAYFYK